MRGVDTGIEACGTAVKGFPLQLLLYHFILPFINPGWALGPPEDLGLTLSSAGLGHPFKSKSWALTTTESPNVPQAKAEGAPDSGPTSPMGVIKTEAARAGGPLIQIQIQIQRL